MNRGYKYGLKTTSQVNNLPTGSLEVGDNVYNTDLKKEEFWTGANWINDDCFEFINGDSITLEEGDVVQYDVNGSPNQVTRVTADQYLVGVVFRGNTVGNKVIVATTGIYNVKHDTNYNDIDANFGGFISPTSGLVRREPENPPIFGYATGGVGRFMESKTGIGSVGLIKMFIQIGDYL